jgi:dienelactone hydrolase
MIRAARHTALALIMAGLLAGCVAGGTPPLDAENVTFASRDAIFLDDLTAAGTTTASHTRSISGLLGMPTRELGERVPAAVILHTSSGPSALEWGMAAMLNAVGIASLVVDSFGPRGVRRTANDQTSVTEASMIADAYGALNFLAADPRIRADRIAVIGFSKGGVAALYSAMTEVAEALSGPSSPRFAAHIAYYPWCGLSLLEPHTTGAPILIQMGEKDTLTSPAQCRELVDAVRRSDSRARIELRLYPGAGHAFDHPILAYMPPLTITAQNPGSCRIAETAPHIYREISTDKPIDHNTYRAVVTGCLGHGGVVAYDSVAADLATQGSLAFLHANLNAR